MVEDPTSVINVWGSKVRPLPWHNGSIKCNPYRSRTALQSATLTLAQRLYILQPLPQHNGSMNCNPYRNTSGLQSATITVAYRLYKLKPLPWHNGSILVSVHSNLNHSVAKKVGVSALHRAVSARDKIPVRRLG